MFIWEKNYANKLLGSTNFKILLRRSVGQFHLLSNESMQNCQTQFKAFNKLMQCWLENEVIYLRLCLGQKFPYITLSADDHRHR